MTSNTAQERIGAVDDPRAEGPLEAYREAKGRPCCLAAAVDLEKSKREDG